MPKKREYTFYLTEGFRTYHVKANTLREAWRKTVKYYLGHPKTMKVLGNLTSMYQSQKHHEDYVLSGWKCTKDKQILNHEKHLFKRVENVKANKRR